MTALFTIVESYRADLDALNAMDIDADEFGNPEFGSGPLPGLT